jgi:asparagine synthase (glutamine-hydrolysing)
MRDAESPVLVYNGEIYNFHELRNDLARAGAQFQTTGDTEVLWELLNQRGESGLRRLEGMFTLAFWDQERRRLVIARDAFGIKPLYWCCRGDVLFFASTLDALHAWGIATSLSEEFLASYLTFGHGTGGMTPYREVEELRPGTLVEVSVGGRETVSRFAETTTADASNGGISSDVARDRLRATIWNSVERHAISDVPVGVFLSGGIDSSLIAAAYATLTPDLQTFSVGFADPRFDESRYARDVARRIGARHTAVELGESEVATLLPQYARAFDEPIGDFACLPTLLVSEAAASSVKVVLSGEGGDELFGGYPRYAWSRRVRSVPRWARGIVGRAVRDRFPRKARLIDWNTWDVGYVRWLEFGAPWADGSPYVRAFRDLGLRGGAKAFLWASMSLDQQGRLVDSYLKRLDRATMFYGLEGRVPFVDKRVQLVASSLPNDERIRRARHGKVALRAVAQATLGTEVAARRKQGFGVPAQFLVTCGPVREAAIRLGSALRDEGVGGYLSGVLEDAPAGGDSTSFLQWWYLFSLALWAEQRSLLSTLATAETLTRLSGSLR